MSELPKKQRAYESVRMRPLDELAEMCLEMSLSFSRPDWYNACVFTIDLILKDPLGDESKRMLDAQGRPMDPRRIVEEIVVLEKVPSQYLIDRRCRQLLSDIKKTREKNFPENGKVAD